jgi:hypothetical protein
MMLKGKIGDLSISKHRLKKSKADSWITCKNLT